MPQDKVTPFKETPLATFMLLSLIHTSEAVISTVLKAISNRQTALTNTLHRQHYISSLFHTLDHQSCGMVRGWGWEVAEHRESLVTQLVTLANTVVHSR